MWTQQKASAPGWMCTVTAESIISTRWFLYSHAATPPFLPHLFSNQYFTVLLNMQQRKGSRFALYCAHIFSKQSGMPHQQKAVTLFSKVINWNGKPAYCDSITKELLRSSTAGVIASTGFDRIQLCQLGLRPTKSSLAGHQHLQNCHITKISIHKQKERCWSTQITQILTESCVKQKYNEIANMKQTGEVRWH